MDRWEKRPPNCVQQCILTVKMCPAVWLKNDAYQIVIIWLYDYHLIVDCIIVIIWLYDWSFDCTIVLTCPAVWLENDGFQTVHMLYSPYNRYEVYHCKYTSTCTCEVYVQQLTSVLQTWRPISIIPDGRVHRRTCIQLYVSFVHNWTAMLDSGYQVQTLRPKVYQHLSSRKRRNISTSRHCQYTYVSSWHLSYHHGVLRKLCRNILQCGCTTMSL